MNRSEYFVSWIAGWSWIFVH